MTDILKEACARAAEYAVTRLNRMPRPVTLWGSVSVYDHHGIMIGSWSSRHVEVIDQLAPVETRSATAIHYTLGRAPWAMILAYWLDDRGVLCSRASKVQLNEHSEGRWRALSAESMAHIDHDPVREVIGRTLHGRSRYAA